MKEDEECVSSLCYIYDITHSHVVKTPSRNRRVGRSLCVPITRGNAVDKKLPDSNRVSRLFRDLLAFALGLVSVVGVSVARYGLDPGVHQNNVHHMHKV